MRAKKFDEFARSRSRKRSCAIEVHLRNTKRVGGYFEFDDENLECGKGWEK